MMKPLIAATFLALLAACQSTPKLEDDARYVRMATVVDIHEFSDNERQQARATRPDDTHVGMGISVGVGTGGTFGGLSLGIGSRVGKHDKQPPHIADGANRITVQLVGGTERIEVMSLGKYQIGDCVKVLAGHPVEFPRLFALKPGEHCK